MGKGKDKGKGYHGGGGGVLGALMSLLGGGKGKGKGKGRRGPNIAKIDSEKKVWVGNLPTDQSTWKELNELFKTVGHVKWVAPLGKKDRGESCVVMNTAEEASEAIAKLQGSVIGGNAIELDVWTPQ